MSGFLPFDDLWTMAVSCARSHNGLVYHPCCDSWTTKSSKLKRKSHLEKIQWREIILKLDKNHEDKKEELLSKMRVEGWRLPAILNKHCSAQPKKNPFYQGCFKFHQQDLSPIGNQPSHALDNLVNSTPVEPEKGNQSGTYESY